MAALTTAPDAGQAHRYGDKGVAIYHLIESPATNIKVNTTSSWVDAIGAVGADVHAKMGSAVTDGSFTVKLQGANTPSDTDDWADLGAASAAMAAAEAKASTGVLHGSATTSGTIGYGVNMPRYIRAVLVAGGAPATGGFVDYVHLILRY